MSNLRLACLTRATFEDVCKRAPYCEVHVAVQVKTKHDGPWVVHFGWCLSCDVFGVPVMLIEFGIRLVNFPLSSRASAARVLQTVGRAAGMRRKGDI